MTLLSYIAIFIMVVLFVLWGISFYFIKTERLSVRRWYRNSLGLPQGTVRAIIAIAFISTLICSSFEGTVISDLPDWAVGITGSIIGFYFGAAVNRRDPEEETASSTPTEKAPDSQVKTPNQ